MFLVLACNIKRIFCRRGMKEAITCMDKLLSKKNNYIIGIFFT